MSNPYNGSKHGKSGGRFRPSRSRESNPMLVRESDNRPSALRRGLPVFPSVPTDSTKIADGCAVGYECTDFEVETAETHVVPRLSLGRKLHLRLFPQEQETIPQDVIRRDPKTGHIIEVIQRNKTIWRSDRTLLKQGKPVQEIEAASRQFKRRTSRSKRIENEPYAGPAVVEVPTTNDEPELDGIKFTD